MDFLRFSDTLFLILYNLYTIFILFLYSILFDRK